MTRKWWLLGGLVLMLLVIGIIKNNQPRQKEAWVYNQHGRLIKHYALPADRQKLTELGRIIGDSGGEAEHVFASRPAHATVKRTYRWRENGKTTTMMVYDNREIYVEAATVIRARGKLTHHEYQQLTHFK